MAEGTQPSFHLRLTPSADGTGDITGLNLRAALEGLSLRQGDALFSFGRQGVPKGHRSRYPYHLPHHTSLNISDERGPLTVTITGHEGAHQAFVDRETHGGIVTEWEVPASEEGGGQRDGLLDFASTLHCDQGGLIGAGRYFLPRFNIGRGRRTRISVEWDLSGLPPGTRAACSLGEGPGPITVQGGADTLPDSVFMAGRINSHLAEPPPPPRDPGDRGSGGGTTYWLGDLAPNLYALTGYATGIFPRMAEHFADEKEGSYRSFIRRVPRGPRLISAIFWRSSIVEYADDEDTRDEPDWGLVRLLNRAMVSAWARLDAEGDGAGADGNDWFTDGLSLLYTVFLPFRLGQRGPDYFRATVNAFLSAYYTNPLVTQPYAGLGDGGCWYAASARATRAFVYMLKMDFLTRRAAKARGEDVLRPADDLVRNLLMRRRDGETVRKKDWLAGVAYWLGQEDADRHFREMVENEDGRVNGLDELLSSFGSKHGPHPVEQEKLEFGFDRKSLEDGAVGGIVEGSRAWEAGLRDGDRITWHSRPEACEADIEKKFRLRVERGSEKVDVEYWPRSREKVICWQVLEGKYEPPTK